MYVSKHYTFSTRPCILYVCIVVNTRTAVLLSNVHSLFSFSFAGTLQVRSMFVQTQETPNPASMMFLPGEKVMEVDHMLMLEYNSGAALYELQ
jgi:hypothetical protein